jgi:hypothetical protein
VIVERQRGVPRRVGLSVIRIDRDDVATWAWRSKASSFEAAWTAAREPSESPLLPVPGARRSGSARNLRVPVIAANLDHVRLPDELQFLLQRTQFVDVSGLAASSDDQQLRHAAMRSLDEAILGAVERARRLNPHRALLRIGRVFQAVGWVSLYVGFFGIPLSAAGVIIGRVTKGEVPIPPSDPLFPVVYGVVSLVSNTLAPFMAGVISLGLFIVGGLLASSGNGIVKAGRARGL